MKEQKEKKRVKKLSGEKRFYLITALGASLAIMAIIVATVAVSGTRDTLEQVGGTGSNNISSGSSNDKDDEQVVVTPDGMLSPLETVTVLNEYGFYHNQTLGAYYVHAGVDFSASVVRKCWRWKKG